MICRKFIALVILALAGEIRAAAQISTYSVKVRTEEVRIDVLVTDHGKPVRGLGPVDFEVFDNGVAQKVAFASLELIPLNATLALDMSASVAGTALDNLKNAGRSFLESLKKDDQAALVTFSHAIALGSRLTTDKAMVRAALEQSQPSGNTSLFDACYCGLLAGELQAGRRLLIVFSDGLDTSSWLTPDVVLEAAKRGDTVTYAVSSGRLPDVSFLRSLCKFTGGSLFEVESTKNLHEIFLGILGEFRERYLVTYSPEGVSKEGWHRLEIRVKGRNVTIKARPGYLVGAVTGGATGPR